MELQEVKALVDDFNDELSDSTWTVLVDVFTTLDVLYAGKNDKDFKVAVGAATAIAYGDMDIYDWLDVVEGQSRKNGDVKATIIGAVLATAWMNGGEVEDVATENELLDYLVAETVMCNLQSDEWNSRF